MNPPFKGRGISENPAGRFESRKSEDDREYLEYQYGNGKDSPKVRTRLLAVFPRKVINRVDSPDLSMAYSLNPYQGCEHGCTYCYARNTHAYWGYSPGLDFEQTVMYKPAVAQLLHRELAAAKWSPDTVVLSGNTDCYQPAERKLKLTRRCLEVFLAHRNPVGIITKNALVLRDRDVLARLASLNLIRVHISLTTRDEGVRRAMEPRTASYESRIRTIEDLPKAGIPVSVMIAPIIPGLNSHEIMAMAADASAAGATSMGAALVRLNGALGELFTNWLKQEFPDRAERILSQIRSCHEGKLNEARFGVRARVTGPVALQIQQLIRLSRKKYYSGNPLPALNRDAFVRHPKELLHLPDDAGQLRLL